MNVEIHIRASDAARQEVKQLQGTINGYTPEEEAKVNASDASDKAKKARHEYFAAQGPRRATSDAKASSCLSREVEESSRGC